MNRILDVATSVLSTVLRAGSGVSVGTLGRRPEKPLELYEFESCPFCRKAREALTILDLDAMIYPCPKKGGTYRDWVIERGGKAQFPYLVDPNTGKEMYESDDIVQYLFREYGNGSVPALLNMGPLTTGSASLAAGVRFGAGTYAAKAKVPEKPLELYSFEASPFCRIVREALTSYELPYLLHNVGKGSAKREAFVARSGKMMVPYLVDPNTGVEMFESGDILEYLERTYAE